MTKLNFGRKGPPRPASSNMDHPQAIERLYVHHSDADKKRRAAQAAERKRELNYKSYVHDLQRTLGPEGAKAIASILTDFKPND